MEGEGGREGGREGRRKYVVLFGRFGFFSGPIQK